MAGRLGVATRAGAAPPGGARSAGRGRPSPPLTARVAGRMVRALEPGRDRIQCRRPHRGGQGAERTGLARAINAEAPAVLAREAAREIDALVVHYSTDYVFDGGGDAPRCECAHPRRCRDWADQARGRTGHPRKRRPPFDPAHQLGLCPRAISPRPCCVGRERQPQVIADRIGANPAALIADVSAHGLRATLPAPTFRHCAAPFTLAAAGLRTTWQHSYACHVIAEARAWRDPGGNRRWHRADPHLPAYRPTTPAQFTPRHRQAAPRLRPVLPDWQHVTRMLDEILPG